MGKIFYFFIVIIFFPGVLFSQKLMLSIDDKSESIINFQKQYNIGDVKIIYGKDIYPHVYNKVNETTLKRAIIKAFPDVNSTGYGVLDWEGKAFHTLIYKDSKNKEFKNTIAQFVKALQIAKQMRPNVKWGFFNLPFRRLLFNSDSKWMTQNNHVHDLLVNIDIFYPVFYPRTLNDRLDVGFLNLLKRLNIKYEKEVVAFIWHRVEGSENRYSKINKTDFVNNAKILLDDANVSKVVWWSQDTYFYRNKNKTFLNEAKSWNDFQKNYENLIIDYSETLLKNE